MSEPPSYILVAHSSLQHGPTGQGNVLIHADIEYRYADDPPRSLFPQSLDEHVLVFNYDPANPTRPTISSTSSQLALSGIKVLPAPGAHVDDDPGKNGNMYILEVTSTFNEQPSTDVESSHALLQNPRAIVARFKQRNTDLRRILEYPDASPKNQLPEPNLQPHLPFSG